MTKNNIKVSRVDLYVILASNDAAIRERTSGSRVLPYRLRTSYLVREHFSEKLQVKQSATRLDVLEDKSYALFIII